MARFEFYFLTQNYVELQIIIENHYPNRISVFNSHDRVADNFNRNSLVVLYHYQSLTAMV